MLTTIQTFKKQGKFMIANGLRFLIMLMVSTIAIHSLKAQSIYTQDFSFSGALTSNGWTAHSGSGTNAISTTTGLTYAGYAGSGVGNAALINNLGGEDINSTFTSQSTNGSSVYAAFLCNVTEAATAKTGDVFFHLGSPGGASWTAFAARVFARVVSGNVNFGISNTSTATYGTTNFSKNTTYLLVVKYTITTGTGADALSLWVLPSGVPASEALAGTAEVTNTTTNGTDAISAVGLRQGSATTSPTVIVDGIRVGSSWANAAVSSSSATITGAATATAFTTTYGTASTAQNFSISGSNLTAEITATAPTGFEVSNDGTTYGNTATFTQSGGSASGTLRVRLKANASVTGTYNTQNIVLSSTGATSVNIATASSGNSVTAQGLTITGLSAQDKNFDGTTSATVTGTPAYSGLVNSESFSVTGTVSWAFPSSAVGNNYTLVRTGNYNAPSSNYTVTQPTLTASILAQPPVINSSLIANGTYAEAFTYTITATNSPYDFNAIGLPAGLSVDFTGVISGTPSVPGTYNVDIIAINDFGSDTATLVITIDKANQTITFGALAPKFVGDPDFTLNGTSSAGLTVSYSSSNTSVATISGNTVTIVGAGTTTITASQAGNSNYNAAPSVDQALSVSVLTSPTITTLGTLSAMTTTYGTASTAQSFTVGGAGLTNDILVTPPAGFEVSVTDATSGFAGTQTLAQSGGSVSSTTVYVRISATTPAGSPSGDIALTSTGATTVNVAIPSSTVAQKGVSITGISIDSKTYDATTTASISGTATIVGLENGDVITLSGTPVASFATAAVGTGISVTVSGYTLDGSAATNYSLTQPSGFTANITAREITVSGAVAADKTYDGNTTATISAGTLNGVQGSDAITLSANGTFAQSDAGNNIQVTVSLSGTGLSNYSLTQPGITANILKANQTISFSSIANRNTLSANFKLSATSPTSSITPITYISSNTAVAVVFGDSVDIVGAGSVTITASQAGSTNYNAASGVSQTFSVTEVVAAWDFFGESSPVSSAADIYNAKLDASASLTRGSGAASSSGSNSFRSQGFQNNGIATTNTDFFQFTVSTVPGSIISFKTIDARFAGTASFYASPGVTHQFAYSTDGTNFTLIGSPLQTTSLTPPTFDLSGVTALQNVGASTTVTFRYYASGQTTTGGWGFSSSSTAGVYGLAVGAEIVSVPTLSLPTAINITTNSADLGATINATGGSTITERGTVWGTSANPTGNSLAEGGTSLGAFTHNRSGLSPNIQYFYRGYAVNSAGTGYSADGSFVTLANVPATPTVNNATSATLDVTVNANSNPSATEFAIQETTSGNYVQANGSLGASEAWNTVLGWGPAGKVTVTGLSLSTTYTFRVKARNSNNVETAFSSSASETTTSQIPTITALGSPVALSTVYGTPSTTTSFTVSGLYLTDDLLITAPAGFEISQTSSTAGFAATQTLAQSSGTVTTTTIFVRLTGATAGSFSGNISITSSGAVTSNVNIPASVVTPLALSISGLIADNKAYDATNTATLTGTATLNGVINSDDVSLSGTATSTFNNKNVGTSKPVTVSGYSITGTAASNYSLTQPSGLTANITPATLTVAGAVAADKSFDSTTVATITAGTLNGVIGSDIVSLNASGTFATPFAGTGIAVTLNTSGTDAGNYSLTQPGITANINKANQTITFNTLINRRSTETRFTLFATSTSRLPVSFSSSNTGVVSLIVDTAFINGAGTSVITASQSGDANYNPAVSVNRTQLVIAPIAEWSFNNITTTNTGSTPVLTAGSAVADLGSQTTGTLFTANHASALSLWSNPAGNGSAKSLTVNTWAIGDYYQFKVNTSGYYNIAVSLDQTGSNTGPNSFKLQYSTDGVNYTDFGSPYAITNDSWNVNSVRTQSIKSFDLSSITALNNKNEIYFRVVCASVSAISGTFGAGGTNRIDNFSVSGSSCSGTPAPSFTITQPTCSVATGSITITSPTGAGYTYSTGGAYQSSTVFSGLTPGDYAVSLTDPTTGCNTATPANATVNPQPFVPATPTVTGPQNICNLIGTEQTATYVASTPGATSYTWTIPSFTQIVSGQGTNTLVVRFLTGFATQTVSTRPLYCKANSTCGSSINRIYSLYAVLPQTPRYITPSTADVCPSLGTGVPITYTTGKIVGAASYIWTAQAGTTNITSVNGAGENDTVVAVTFESNFTTSSISVRAVNDCGVSSLRSITISRSNPATPALISGPTNACAYIGANGQVATYSVAALSAFETYNWTIPAGATDVTGSTTRTISFRYPDGYTGGTISVQRINGCGSSGTRSLSIGVLQATSPSSIDVVNTATCPNRVYTYSVSSIPSQATSLLWTIPSGGTIVSGQGTTSITVSYTSGVIAGEVTVRGVNNCSVGSLRRLNVKLQACPTGFAGGDGTLTKGNTATAVTPMEVQVFPNPSAEAFNLQVITAAKETVKVRVLDVSGRFIRSYTIAPNTTLNLGAELKTGTYLLETSQGKSRQVSRVVKL